MKQSDGKLEEANRIKQIEYWQNSAIHDLDVAALNKARAFVRLLKTNGINVHEAYMFGSAARETADKFSDIDIAVVSDSFAGIPFYDVKKISRFRRSIDLRLEVHPFSLTEIQTDPPVFFLDIRREGFRI